METPIGVLFMMNDINAIYTIWLREMIRYLRDRMRIISSIATAFFYLTIVAVGIGSFASVGNLDFKIFMAPGVIGITILFTSMFSGMSVIWDRQFGFLKEILVAPVSRTSVILGKMAGSATIALSNGLLVLILAIILVPLPITIGILPAIVFMILTSFAIVSIGLIIASRMRSMEGFQAILSFIIMPLFFLAGVFFPLNAVPAHLRLASMLDPLTYGVDGLRGSLIGTQHSYFPLLTDFGVLLAFDIVMIIIASYLFNRTSV